MPLWSASGEIARDTNDDLSFFRGGFPFTLIDFQIRAGDETTEDMAVQI
jgi:hypothetical protein